MRTKLAAGLVLMLGAFAVQAAQRPAGADEGYPIRPVRLIVPQAPGGSNDIMARYAAQYLTTRLGKTVVVDNRPGGDGVIGTEMVARSAPDGHTLLLASSAFTMNSAVRKLPYDSLKAFEWVAMLGSGPTLLTVGPSLQVNTVKELIAAAKARPGQITMASAGGFQHFAHALFRSLSGTDMIIVLYRGGAPALMDVLGGQAHLTIGTIIQSLPHVRAQKVKALATGSAKRATTLPDLPTIAEAGVPGYEASNWWSLAVPAGTPPAIIARLSSEIATFLKTPETRKRFTDDGVEVDIKTPAELGAMVAADMVKWAKVAKTAGIRAE